MNSVWSVHSQDVNALGNLQSLHIKFLQEAHNIAKDLCCFIIELHSQTLLRMCGVDLVLLMSFCCVDHKLSKRLSQQEQRKVYLGYRSYKVPSFWLQGLYNYFIHIYVFLNLHLNLWFSNQSTQTPSSQRFVHSRAECRMFTGTAAGLSLNSRGGGN